MDMDVDPPPDLAIEADVTSETTFAAYATLRVPELWIYENNRLQIYWLEGEGYRESKQSLAFPEVDVSSIMPALVQRAFQIGTSQMLREFRTTLPQRDPPLL